MAKKYILVEITKGRIIELRKVSEEEKFAVNSGKKANQYLYAAESIKEARANLKAHNDVITEGVNKVKEKQVFAAQAASVTPTQIKLWDWSKVTSKVKNQLIKAYKVFDFRAIFKIHNELKLSPVNYCCDSYEAWVKYNLEKANADGILQLG